MNFWGDPMSPSKWKEEHVSPFSLKYFQGLLFLFSLSLVEPLRSKDYGLLFHGAGEMCHVSMYVTRHLTVLMIDIL